MNYVQEIDGCMVDAIGGSGMSSQEFLWELEGCEKALENLRQACERQEIPALDTEKSLTALEFLLPLTENIRESFKTVVVLVLINALCGPTLGVSAYQWALNHWPAGIVLPIVALTPLVVIPFAMRFEGERPTLRSIIGSALAVAGVIALGFSLEDVIRMTTTNPARASKSCLCENHLI